MRRRSVFLAAKVVLGLALLAALLLWNDNLAKVVGLFARFRFEYLAPLALVTLLLVVVSCLKWGMFLRERGSPVPLRRLLGLYTIGNFFSNFLPSMFGGDVVRGYVLGRQIGSQSRSMASVFLERFTGLVALESICLATLAFRPELLADPLVAVSVATMVVGSAAVGLLLWSPPLAKRVSAAVRSRPLGSRLVEGVGRLREEIVFFARRPRALAAAMLYSFAFHGLAGVNTYLAARAIGLELPLLVVVALTPLILLVSSVPLTPNGIGVWEWAFTVFLGSAGALPEQGLAVALVLRAEHIATSLIGGLLFMLDRSAVPSLGRQRPVEGTASPPEAREES